MCINDAASGKIDVCKRLWLLSLLCPDTGNDPEQADAGGYHTVDFSYGNPDEFTEQKNNDTEPVFQPAFPVPESLIQNLVSLLPYVSYLSLYNFIWPVYYCLFDS